MPKHKIWLIIFGTLLLVSTSVFVYQYAKIKQYESEFQNQVQQTAPSSSNPQDQNAALQRQIKMLEVTQKIMKANLWRGISAISMVLFALLGARIVYKQRKNKDKVSPDQLIDEIGR